MAAASKRTLFVIRMAMTSGIIAFATGVWYIRQSAPPALSVEDGITPRRLALGAAVLSTLGLLALRRALAETAVERRNAMSVIGWGVGEFAALAGIVAWFLTGVQSVAAPGMLVYVMSLLMFPIRRER